MIKNTYKKSIKPNRVIIFGSNGFVAKNLKKTLLNKKIKVKSFSKNHINLLKINSRKIISNNVKSYDQIVFIAAEAPVKNIKMYLNNLNMLINFIKGIQNINFEQLIYISSDAVYSDTKNNIKENFSTKPNSLHGQMHIMRENILENLYSDKLCILRPTLIYGHDDPHNGYGPNKFIRYAKKNNDIDLFGFGEEMRDHVFINDVVEIIYNCLINKSIGKLNIASGKVISFNAIAKIIKKISKKSFKIIYNKRIGKMPHNGYRSFDIKSTNKVFPNFKYKHFEKIINKIYNKY